MKIDKEWLIQQFTGVLDQMRTTMINKNNDYSTGDDPFKNLRRHGPYGIIVRMDDKLSRLDSFTNPAYGGFSPQVTESLEDTAIDNAVYSILLVCLNRAIELESRCQHHQLPQPCGLCATDTPKSHH